MRIGELSRRAGVSSDTVRFYERSGWLPRASRQANDYREYEESDVEHLRLLIELRRLEIPLDEAARLAGWCHSGHCAESSEQLPGLIDERRGVIAERISGLQALDRRLEKLRRHLGGSPRALRVIDNGVLCCEAADAVVSTAEGGCSCCSNQPPASAG